MLNLSNIKAVFDGSGKVIIGCIAVLFCFDFIDKIEIFYEIDFIKFNRLLKGVFVIYVLIFIGFHLKYVFDSNKHVVLTLIVLFVLFIFKCNSTNSYLNEFARYFFGLIIIPLLHYTYFQKKNKLLYHFYQLLKVFILANAIAITIGILFNIDIFNAYKLKRFGFNGFILSQGLTPYVYLCATAIFWRLNERKMLFLTLILSALSGIKGVYFGEFLILSLLVLFNQNINQKIKLQAITILSFIFALLLLIIFSLSPFKELIDSNGLITAIFSLRTDNLIDLLGEINRENFNILIGATKLETLRLEMQIFDIVLFFGIIGLFIFMYFVYKFYTQIVNNSISKALFISALVLSALSGNLFYIPLSSLLFYLTLFVLNIKE